MFPIFSRYLSVATYGLGLAVLSIGAVVARAADEPAAATPRPSSTPEGAAQTDSDPAQVARARGRKRAASVKLNRENEAHSGADGGREGGR